MLTIACVYKPGNGFTDEYVYRLREGVAKHCQAPHRFVVLTNQRFEDFETVRLSRNVPGWWNKLDLFREGLFDGQVVYFDLDTMIVGDITGIATTPQDFAMLRDFYGKHRVNSGVMVWDATRDWGRLYREFTPARIPEYSETQEKWGDQGWISDHLPVEPARLQDLFPGQIVSYKADVRRKTLPADARVVCFHGRPRPSQIGWSL